MIVKELIYTAWTTLDGYLGDEDDGMSWVRGDDQMSEYEIGIVDSADTLMLGRKTYEDFYGYWPQVPDSKDAAGLGEDLRREAQCPRQGRRLDVDEGCAVGEIDHHCRSRAPDRRSASSRAAARS